MILRKALIKLAKRIERSWESVDLFAKPEPEGIPIRSGWYLTEFNIEGSVNHVPAILVKTARNIEVRRRLIGFHSGRNRMLIYLPSGHITAYDTALEFDFLSRLSEIEGRSRVMLICMRYLIDFFSFKSLVKIIAIQFQNRFDLSTDLLQFYLPKDHLYLAETYRWERFKSIGWLVSWFVRNVKVAVLIEQESQRSLLEDQIVQADQVILAGTNDRLEEDIDYLIPLAATETLREAAIAMIKFTIKKSKIKPALLYSDHDYQDSEVDGRTVLHPVLKPQASLAYLHCFDYLGPAVVLAAEFIEQKILDEYLLDSKRYYASIELFQQRGGAVYIPGALFSSSKVTNLITPEPLKTQTPWKNIQWQRHTSYNVLSANSQWQEQPSVDLIIPTRDGLDVLKPCIDSILNKTDYSNFLIYIVDNNSELTETKQYLQEIALHPQVMVISFPGEFNYSAINNFATSQGSSDYIALINNDIEVINSDWLLQMMAWASEPNVGIVGAKLLFGDGRVQHAGVTIGMGNAAGHIHRLADGESLGYQNRLVATQNMMAVTAACLVTPRQIYEELNGLDDESFKVAYNDIDYCLRVEQRGLDIIWTPEAKLYHHESVSRGDDMSEQHIERYFNELSNLQKRWKTKGFVDKYYNKYLRISDEGVYPQVIFKDSGEMRRLDNQNLSE